MHEVWQINMKKPCCKMVCLWEKMCDEDGNADPQEAAHAHIPLTSGGRGCSSRGKKMKERGKNNYAGVFRSQMHNNMYIHSTLVLLSVYIIQRLRACSYSPGESCHY